MRPHDPRDDWPRRELPHWNDHNVTVGFLLCALVVVVLLIFGVYAFGHIKDHPELDAWMNKLQSKGGFPCCSHVDGSTLPDADWDTAVVGGRNRYRVRVDGRWIVVSDEEVVEGPNRYGPAIAWIYRDSTGVPNIRCFMPGAGT